MSVTGIEEGAEAKPADVVEVAGGMTPPGSISRRAEWGALGVVVLVAAALRFWRLDLNGFANPYYAAAVRSMLASAGNYFFGSFDPTGMVTVDKPPGALWVQAASAWAFGYKGVNLLWPQGAMGVASVLVTYHLVRRAFGAPAALVAALALALTPIGVAVDRDNLPDPALVLLLLLASWALVVAVENGRWGPLLASAALVGLAFNVKMLAAFVVLPTFCLVYYLAAPLGRSATLGRLAAAGAVVAAVSLSWCFAVGLTPKDRRPYVGGSQRNSALDLALGYNGLGRVFGGSNNFGPPPGGRPAPGFGAPRTPEAGAPAPVSEKADAAEPKAAGDDDDAMMPPFPPGGPGGPGGPGMGGGPPFGRGGPPMFGGMPGPLRFFRPNMAVQITWLFPLAVLGGLAAAAARPVGRARVTLGLWAGWFLTHWVVFSFARGIFHEYYTTVMGPAVAGLVGAGTAALWGRWAATGGRRWAWVAAAVVLTAAWQAFLVALYPGVRLWLLPVLGLGAAAGVVGLVWGARLDARTGSLALAKRAAGVGLASLLVAPAFWSATSATARGNGMMPSAGPPLPGGMGGLPGGMPPGGPFGMEGQGTQKLVNFLRANRHGERIFVASMSSMEAAPVIIETGEPAVALGGFMGADPVLTKEQFAAMVERGEVRFFLAGGGPGGPGGPPGLGRGGPGGGPPGGPGRSEVMAWVREHAEPVDRALWQENPPAAAAAADAEAEKAGPEALPGGPGGPGSGAFFARMRRAAKLYDCKPSLGIVDPSAR